jgi:predicted DNA-binding transcriptional regulator YafY
MSAQFDVDGLDETVWWIMSYGLHCNVIEPAELRVRVIALPKEMMWSYEM